MNDGYIINTGTGSNLRTYLSFRDVNREVWEKGTNISTAENLPSMKNLREHFNYHLQFL